MADDTIVIFTSDHGDMMGDHGLILKGVMHFQGCLRAAHDPRSRPVRRARFVGVECRPCTDGARPLRRGRPSRYAGLPAGDPRRPNGRRTQKPLSKTISHPSKGGASDAVQDATVLSDLGRYIATATDMSSFDLAADPDELVDLTEHDPTRSAEPK